MHAVNHRQQLAHHRASSAAYENIIWFRGRVKRNVCGQSKEVKETGENTREERGGETSDGDVNVPQQRHPGPCSFGRLKTSTETFCEGFYK